MLDGLLLNLGLFPALLDQLDDFFVVLVDHLPDALQTGVTFGLLGVDVVLLLRSLVRLSLGFLDNFFRLLLLAAVFALEVATALVVVVYLSFIEVFATQLGTALAASVCSYILRMVAALAANFTD